jgi:hypothetical protein
MKRYILNEVPSFQIVSGDKTDPDILWKDGFGTKIGLWADKHGEYCTAKDVDEIAHEIEELTILVESDEVAEGIFELCRRLRGI